MATKLELKKTNDAMARYLIHLCRFSDEVWHGNRDDIVEGHYNRARRLIKRAGFKYEPKEKPPKAALAGKVQP